MVVVVAAAAAAIMVVVVEEAEGEGGAEGGAEVAEVPLLREALAYLAEGVGGEVVDRLLHRLHHLTTTTIISVSV